MKKILFFSLYYIGTVYSAAYEVPHSSQEVAITANSIYPLTQQASPMPQNIKEHIHKWSQEPKIATTLQHLLRFNFNNVQDFKAKKMQDDALLANNGLRNESKANYVFAIPGIEYHMKIAGPSNRIQSALMERGIWPGQQIPSDILQEVLSGKIPTYQTASRAAYFLILKELLQRENLSNMHIPETHLMYCVGCPEDVQDNYVFIIEKNIPAHAVKITDRVLKTVSSELLKQLVHTIIGGGLWSMQDNMFIDEKNNNIYLVDLEQPDNSAPQDFFHKDYARYYGNINAGLEHIIAMLQGEPEKLQLVKSLIESHPIVQSNDYNARYKRELMSMLSKIPSIKSNEPENN